MLDVRQCLAVYLDKTKLFCASPHLFVPYADHMKGQDVSSQMISKWITSCIKPAYEIALTTLPQQA